MNPFVRPPFAACCRRTGARVSRTGLASKSCPRIVCTIASLVQLDEASTIIVKAKVKAKVTPGTPAVKSASRGLPPTLGNGLETRSANARQRMRGRSGGVGAEVTEQEKLSLATPPNNPPAYLTLARFLHKVFLTGCSRFPRVTRRLPLERLCAKNELTKLDCL